MEFITEKLQQYVEQIVDNFASIEATRQNRLKEVSDYISSKRENRKKLALTFICTHNSRRSHFSQIWAQLAAFYYEIQAIECYSGGTEATAFNIRAVEAIQRCGILVKADSAAENPVYSLQYAEGEAEIVAFSKKYNDPRNPQSDYAAIMTCSDADENCPIVFGADKRFPVTYTDPKEADDTPEETATYDLRCKQIATEMFYIFSHVS